MTEQPKQQRVDFAKVFLKTNGFEDIEMVESRIVSLSETLDKLHKISENYWEIHG